MDQRERQNDFQEALRAAFRGWQSDIWTALPGVIQDYDPARIVCSVQASIKIKVRDSQGNETFQKLPLLINCPVVFPTGGGFTMTFPIHQGDECLVIFACRCIDSWWQSGGIDNQPIELRLHDLSDGFVIVGPRSQIRLLTPNPSITNVQLRNDTESILIDISSTQITLKAPTVTVQGNLVVTGTTAGTSDGVFNGHSVTNHVHSDPQGGNTGSSIG